MYHKDAFVPRRRMDLVVRVIGVLARQSRGEVRTDLPTAPLLTGPSIVDKSNIEDTLAGVAKGAR